MGANLGIWRGRKNLAGSLAARQTQWRRPPMNERWMQCRHASTSTSLSLASPNGLIACCSPAAHTQLLCGASTRTAVPPLLCYGGESFALRYAAGSRKGTQLGRQTWAPRGFGVRLVAGLPDGIACGPLSSWPSHGGGICPPQASF